jgi:hypothetical protein
VGTSGKKNWREITKQPVMTAHFKLWRTLPFLLVGAWFFYKLYQTFHKDFIFDGLILFVTAFIGLSLLIWSFYIDIREFKETKKYTSFLPTVVGFIIVSINSGLYLHLDARFNSPTLISGFYDGGFNGFSVDFKKDGSYVMANGSALGQSYFYGKYTINDSVITIDKSQIDGCITVNKLVIRSANFLNGSSETNSNEKHIIQIDQDEKEINQELRFRVTEDNRER